MQNAKAIFLEALDRSPNDRLAFVRKVAPDDVVFREVERLLAADLAAEASDHFDRLTFTLDWDSVASDRPKQTEQAEGDAIGDYVLTERLGRGGHGEVWRAEQLRPVQRDVAIKLLSNVDERLKRRFSFERQALARLDHPDVARVLDAGEWKSVPYLVVELAPGEPATDFCIGNDLSSPDRLAIFGKVCRAVAHAHGRGLLHCDLKPANVLVWRDAADGSVRVKVIDFGIARILGGDADDSVVGTPAYMSPEQAGGGEVDVQSDVYSLGLLLHAMLGGGNPVAAATSSRSRRALAQVAASAPRPEPLRPPVPKEADWIIARATAPVAADRYASAAALARDVDRLLDGRPVQAKTTRWTYRLGKHARRNKPLAAASVAAALVLVGGVAATAYQAVRATRAERIALVDRDAAEDARAEAEDSAESARATSRFLQRVLFSARPGYESSEEREAFVRSVDRARDGLASDLLDRPEVRSELLDMIGMIYFESSRLEEAEPLLEEAYTLRLELFGESDPRTLRSQEQYAGLLRYQGLHDEAIELADEVLRLSEGGDTFGLDLVARNARVTIGESLLLRLGPGDLERLRQYANAAEAEAAEGVEDLSTEQRAHLAFLVLAYPDAVLQGSQAVTAEQREDVAKYIRLGNDLLIDLPIESGIVPVLRHRLANLQARTGQWYDALQGLRMVVPVLREQMGPDAPTTLSATSDLLTLRAIYETRDAPAEQVHEIAAGLRDVFDRTRDQRLVRGASPLMMVLFNAGRFEEVRDVAEAIVAMRPDQVHDQSGAPSYAKRVLAELRERRPDLFLPPSTRPAATTRPG